MTKFKPHFLLTSCVITDRHEESDSLRKEVLKIELEFIGSGDTRKIKGRHILKLICNKLKEIK